ncbi:MAG: hypothetical protein NC221_01755 [Duncaniella sp.]|nr:hypothetical protein [Muribaculum sp.]MCM1254828.1 hypothetical protein [Duncaniella sp.]
MKHLSATFLILLFILICSTGCDRGSDYRRDDPDKPGNGGREEPIKPPFNPDSIQRPGVWDGGYDFSKEMADAEWRYVGCETNLRYGNPGILFKIRPIDDTKNIEIIDIDSSERVDLTISAIGSDSIVKSATLKINRQEVNLSKIKMKKVTGQSIWYHIVTESGANSVLVLPGDF